MIQTIVRYVCDRCGVYREAPPKRPMDLPKGWLEKDEQQHCGRCSNEATRGVPR